MGAKRAVSPSGQFRITLTFMVEICAAAIIVLLALGITRLIWQR
jgi:hypothetical protein